MKPKFIIASLALAGTVLLFSSCHPSRVWATKKKDKQEYAGRNDDANREKERYYTPPTPPPPRYPAVSLVVTPVPGFVMRQSPDGRFYHRSVQGFLYWKGYDNRFYLDATQLRSVSYNRWEYDAWRKYSWQSR
jgi:hypothetical protein